MPREAKVPRLEPIAPRVWLLRGGLLRNMNAYLIEDGDGVVVFDTGEKGMAGTIAAAGARLGGIERVVLGHADTDHRGSAPALSKVAAVYCHADAVGEAQGSGGRSYWHMERLPAAIRMLHRFTHRFIWDGGPVRISGTVAEGEAIAGFEVVDLSGHAPGLIGLWRASDRLALTSDCFYTLDPQTGIHGHPRVPHAAFNLDTEQARASLRKVAELRRRIDAHVAAGGQPVSLEIDGGVKLGNIAAAALAGADIFVAGSAIFGARDPQLGYRGVLDAMRRELDAVRHARKAAA
jgi:glyoxylase-like metal-dependent hydrolase (beta-lactamase superfamily II)